MKLKIKHEQISTRFLLLRDLLKKFKTLYFLFPNFHEQLEGAASCNLLYNAFRRYMEIVQNLPPLVSKDSATAINLHSNYTGELEKLVVSLNGICDDTAYPVLFMDEACKVK